jgi:hypothetical protein
LSSGGAPERPSAAPRARRRPPRARAARTTGRARSPAPSTPAEPSRPPRHRAQAGLDIVVGGTNPRGVGEAHVNVPTSLVVISPRLRITGKEPAAVRASRRLPRGPCGRHAVVGGARGLTRILTGGRRRVNADLAATARAPEAAGRVIMLQQMAQRAGRSRCLRDRDAVVTQHRRLTGGDRARQVRETQKGLFVESQMSRAIWR